MDAAAGGVQDEECVRTRHEPPEEPGRAGHCADLVPAWVNVHVPPPALADHEPTPCPYGPDPRPVADCEIRPVVGKPHRGHRATPRRAAVRVSAVRWSATDEPAHGLQEPWPGVQALRLAKRGPLHQGVGHSRLAGAVHAAESDEDPGRPAQAARGDACAACQRTDRRRRAGPAHVVGPNGPRSTVRALGVLPRAAASSMRRASWAPIYGSSVGVNRVARPADPPPGLRVMIALAEPLEDQIGQPSGFSSISGMPKGPVPPVRSRIRPGANTTSTWSTFACPSTKTTVHDVAAREQQVDLASVEYPRHLQDDRESERCRGGVHLTEESVAVAGDQEIDVPSPLARARLGAGVEQADARAGRVEGGQESGHQRRIDTPAQGVPRWSVLRAPRGDPRDRRIMRDGRSHPDRDDRDPRRARPLRRVRDRRRGGRSPPRRPRTFGGGVLPQRRPERRATTSG